MRARLRPTQRSLNLTELIIQVMFCRLPNGTSHHHVTSCTPPSLRHQFYAQPVYVNSTKTRTVIDESSIYLVVAAGKLIVSSLRQANVIIDNCILQARELPHLKSIPN